MKILVKYYPPFDKLTGIREETLTFEGSLTAGDLIRFLSEKYPKLKEYVNLESDEKQLNRMVLVQNGRFLKIRDNVSEGILMVLAPISGG